MLFHCILICRRQTLGKKELHELARIQINSDLDTAVDWVDFISCSAPTHSFRSIQECQMGLGNVILLQGRELKVENSAEMRALGKVVQKIRPCGQETQESNFFFFFFCRDLVEKMQIKQTWSCKKLKTPHLSYVWVWKWSWHILIVLESSRGKPVTSKWSQIRDTTQAPVRHKFKSPP